MEDNLKQIIELQKSVIAIQVREIASRDKQISLLEEIVSKQDKRLDYYRERDKFNFNIKPW